MSANTKTTAATTAEQAAGGDEATPTGTVPVTNPKQQGEKGNADGGASSIRAALLILGVVLGSVLSNAALQILNNLRPGCGQLVTLLQYVATVTEKSVPPSSAKQYLLNPVLPLKQHVAFVVLMFLVAKTANMCLEKQYGVPFGLFLVIKNTNLVFSLLLGYFALERQYTRVQVACVVAVTVGVIVCVRSKDDGGGGDDKAGDGEGASSTEWSVGFLVGVLLATMSAFFNASFGAAQESAFQKITSDKQRGQAPLEANFYTHLLGLPLFLLGGGLADMMGHLTGLTETSPRFSVAMLLLNVMGSVVLKQCFVDLLGVAGSLTATMAATVAQTLGVVLSVVVMKGEDEDLPGLNFWLGAFTVAAGSTGYILGGKKKEKQA